MAKKKKTAKTKKKIIRILIEVLTGVITGTALLLIEKLLKG